MSYQAHHKAQKQMRRRAYKHAKPALGAAFALALGTGAALGTTTAIAQENPDEDKVCDALDSGKIDVSGGTTLTITAPEGKLIDEYCVKAGSVNQGLGPEYVDVNPPKESVEIMHTSGKDISHYSVGYTDAPPETPPEEPKKEEPKKVHTTPSTIPQTGF